MKDTQKLNNTYGPNGMVDVTLVSRKFINAFGRNGMLDVILISLNETVATVEFTAVGLKITAEQDFGKDGIKGEIKVGDKVTLYSPKVKVIQLLSKEEKEALLKPKPRKAITSGSTPFGSLERY